MAGRRVAGQVAALAVLARVLLRALAPVAADLIDARPAVLAGRRAGSALVHVLFANLSGEVARAGTDVVGVYGGALAVVGARV